MKKPFRRNKTSMFLSNAVLNFFFNGILNFFKIKHQKIDTENDYKGKCSNPKTNVFVKAGYSVKWSLLPTIKGNAISEAKSSRFSFIIMSAFCPFTIKRYAYEKR
jgi:hypothetical protein